MYAFASLFERLVRAAHRSASGLWARRRRSSRKFLQVLWMDQTDSLRSRVANLARFPRLYGSCCDAVRESGGMPGSRFA